MGVIAVRSYHPMRLYVIRVDITEAATRHAYTIVRHEFIGKTVAEARGYFASHMGFASK